MSLNNLEKIIKNISLGLWRSETIPEGIGHIDINEHRISFTRTNAKDKSRGIDPVLHLIESTLNPLDAIGRLTVVSRYGVHKESKTLIGREVDPRFFGSICPLDTPESEKIGITLHLAKDAIIIDDKLQNNNILKNWSFNTPLATKLPDGNWLISYIEIQQYIKDKNSKNSKRQTEDVSKTQQPVEDKDSKSPDWRRYPVKWIIKIGNEEDAKNAIKVPNDYLGFLSLSALLVPFIQHNDGARAMMGAKNAKQALPPIKAEPPIVQTGFEKELAKLFMNIVSYSDIKILHDTRDVKEYIHYDDDTFYFKSRYFDDAKIKINLNSDYISHGKYQIPKNIRPVRLSGFPAFIITPRKEVKENEPFFDITGIKNGILSLGVNALVGYLPFFGYNFEDAIVISESFANRITTRHIYTVDIPPGLYCEKLSLDLKNAKLKGFHKIDNNRNEKEIALPLPPEILSGRNQKILGIFRKEKEEGKLPSPWEVWIQIDKPIQEGDKLTGRHGNKGVVSLILPDEKMPFFELDGEKYYLDVILNPHGVISRMNIGQILETHIGFIIKRLEELGLNEEASKWKNSARPFQKIDFEKLSDDLKKAGLDSYGKIDLYVSDPDSPAFKEKVKAVVGYQYFLRLAHLADEKLTARGVSKRRTFAVNQPTRGRKREGGQRIGEMETWALLAHNAVNTLREFLFEASDAQSDDFLKLRKLKESYNPQAYFALKDILKAAFIEFDISDKTIALDHISDEKFKNMENTEKINDITELIATSREDKIVDNFCFIELPQNLRYIHPWMLNHLFPGKKYADLRKLLSGEAYLVRYDKEWLVIDRKKIDDDKNKDTLKELEKSKRIKVGEDAAIRWLKDRGKELALDNFSHSIVPVLPYKYRIFCDSIGKLYYAKDNPNINAIYASIISSVARSGKKGRKSKNNKKVETPSQIKRKILRLINILFNEHFLELLFPKDGIIRNHILGKRIDRSGRAVIIPDPKITPDTILLPQYMREKLFQRLGKKWNFRILLNRQPTLHKYSIFAFNHGESPDNTIHISPLICTPYNADFDGDTMAVYLPISSEAKKELENMTFLKHWKSIINGKLNLHITQDIKLGLQILQNPPNSLAQNNEILTLLKNKLDKLLKEYGLIDNKMPQVDYIKLIENLDSSKLPESVFAKLLKEISQIAFRSATFSGVTFSVFELIELKQHFHPNSYKFDEIANQLKNWLKSYKLLNSPALLVGTGARGKPSQLVQMLWGRPWPSYSPRSGDDSKPHLEVISPSNHLASSLLDGHSPLEYFILAFTTRLTLGDKKLNVAHAGYLTRKLVHSSFELRITKEDCGSDANPRSPLTCKAKNGICLKCLGDAGENLNIGDFIGILSATSIGERGTQLSMQTFHTAGADKINNLNELSNILTSSIDSIQDASQIVYDLKNGRGKDLYKEIREPFIATIFRARLQDNKILNYKDAINRGDIFAKIAFEEGKKHITKAILYGKYIENIKSTITKLFVLGLTPNLKE